MKGYYRFGVVLAGMCILALTSCIDSENPLSDPAQAKPAKELAGVWRIRQDDGIRYYHVGLAGEKFPAGLMQMTIIDHRKDGRMTVEENAFFLFATTLGERHFVNVTALEPEQLAEVAKSGWKPETFKGYWIYEYQLKGDKIRLLGMDQEQKKTLLESKKLKGVIKNDQVSFQESTENMAKLVVSPEAAKLFQAAEKEELERVK
jgi:hypothetical protein